MQLPPSFTPLAEEVGYAAGAKVCEEEQHDVSPLGADIHEEEGFAYELGYN